MQQLVSVSILKIDRFITAEASLFLFLFYYMTNRGAFIYSSCNNPLFVSKQTIAHYDNSYFVCMYFCN